MLHLPSDKNGQRDHAFKSASDLTVSAGRLVN